MKRALALSVFGLVTAGTIVYMLIAPGLAFTFDKNHIIDDPIFDNPDTMSVESIDNFLNSFASSCLSVSNGYTFPDPTGYSPSSSNVDGIYSYGSAVSAGRVIYDASHAHQINPQVILATLEKEENLVTGVSGCATWRYASATGYSCTDSGTNTHDYSYPNGGLLTPLYYTNNNPITSITGSCVSSGLKAGFSEQVIHTAWLLSLDSRRSRGETDWAAISGPWNHCDDNNTCPASMNIPSGWSCYSGFMTEGSFKRCPTDASTTFYDGYATIDNTGQCANLATSVPVHMDTGATAALYVYTPHICGNYSFFNIFTNWFGSTTAAGYAWSTTGYTITSLDKTVAYDPGKLLPGQTYLATLEAKNMGTQTWTNNGFHPVTLGIYNDNKSMFCNNTWVACNRPAYLQEASVAPEQEGHFVFQFQVPYQLGSYRESFKPVAEELTWFNDYPPYDSFGITVVSPGTYSWNMTGYTIMDQTKTVTVDPGKLQPGQKYVAIATAANTGTATWDNTWPRPVTLATSNVSSIFCTSSWVACNRPALLQEASVAPGQTGHFEFTFQAPFSVGSYRESFKPVAELYTWFNDSLPGESFGVWVVSPGTFTWSTTGYKIYDSTGTTRVDPGQLQHGQTYLATLDATNTGTATWSNSGPIPLHLGASNPTSRTSTLCTNTWLACNRPATLTEASVAPGQTGHFSFSFQAPATPGTYFESFKPVAEMYAWLNDDPNGLFGVVVH